jgi:hypothetical protein
LTVPTALAQRVPDDRKHFTRTSLQLNPWSFTRTSFQLNPRDTAPIT